MRCSYCDDWGIVTIFLNDADVRTAIEQKAKFKYEKKLEVGALCCCVKGEDLGERRGKDRNRPAGITYNPRHHLLMDCHLVGTITEQVIALRAAQKIKRPRFEKKKEKQFESTAELEKELAAKAAKREPQGMPVATSTTEF